MGTISVSNLGKAYKSYPTRWSRLLEWIDPRGRSRHELHWVLKGLNFTVHPGEAVGIIGVNGAGKSTLLKMIAGTAKPTTGSVQTTGRVVALLELGMGFHPEFTGRQNVVMSGQLLGYSSAEIDALMPAIEEFAEVGNYIDEPVRVYSSGMQMRLAFSVATATRPDVLIVDEALSVGDAYFQHKSFDRIRTFRSEGTTLLLVSHDKQAIQAICDRAILLNAGQMELQGVPEQVMDAYNALLVQKEKSGFRQQETVTGKVQTVSGTGEAALDVIALLNESGEPVEILQVGQPVTLSVSVDVKADLPELVMGYMIKDRLGQPVFGTNSHHLKQVLADVKAGQRYVFRFSFDANLGEGTYSIAVALHASESHVAGNFEWRDLALIFNVVNTCKPTFVGVNWLPATLDISQ